MREQAILAPASLYPKRLGYQRYKLKLVNLLRLLIFQFSQLLQVRIKFEANI